MSGYRITGGKVIRKGTRHVVNRAATALRLAATTRLRSQSYLGAQYRRLRARLGAPKAITAMAHKLARLVYRMLKWGHSKSTRVCSTTRRATVNTRCNCSRNGRRRWVCKSSNPTPLDLFRDGFWRG